MGGRSGCRARAVGGASDILESPFPLHTDICPDRLRQSVYRKDILWKNCIFLTVDI